MSNPVSPPEFGRSPRFVESIPNDIVEIPDPPQEPAEPANSLMYALLPLGITILVLVVVSFVAEMQTLLYFSVPLMMSSAIGSYYIHRSQKKDANDKRIARNSKYQALLREYRDRLRHLYQKQYDVRRRKDPGIQECLRSAQQLAPILWSRSPIDDDFLSVRIGQGNLSSSITIKVPSNKNPIEPDPLIIAASKMAEDYKEIAQVPLCLNLPSAGVLGIAGVRAEVLEVASAFIVHLATHHSPNEVKIAALFPEDEWNTWEWIRWLPHTWDDRREHRRLAMQPAEISELLKFLETLLDERNTFIADRTSSDDFSFGLSYILLIANSVPDEQRHILNRLQAEGPGLGIFSVYLSDRTSTLPASCRSVVRLRDQSSFVRIRYPESKEFALQPDKITSKELTLFASSLAPLRLPGIGKSEIPTMVSFLEMFSARNIEELDIQKRWDKNRSSTRTLSAPIGMTFGDQLLALDLHERADGPNGLVAGTVGAGKSELLQTLVLSLAVNYPPDKLGFVLVDYKGGGMAKPFQDLPHNFGIITDLEQKNLAVRAIRSFDVELRRRKNLFNEFGINHIDQYQKLYYSGQAEHPLPYLVIIVDEFAEMKSEQPETAQDFVRIARTGRALGLRLILAMQKPAGIVDGQIEANTRFRLCLRVAQTDDSQAMLKRPDAAYLRGLGRAYLQVGANEVFREFQVAYCGASYDPEGMTLGDPNRIDRVALNGTRTTMVAGITESSEEEKTQLNVIVSYLQTIDGAQDKLKNYRLWLPPLDKEISLNRISHSWGWSEETNSWLPAPSEIALKVGVVDRPEEKLQTPLIVNLSEGHLAIYGAPGYGKTNLIQTLIVSAARSYPPSEVNIYALDFDGQLLRQQFAEMPHVGAIVCSDEEERINRLFGLLRQEMVLRRKLLGEAQISSLHQYRKEGKRDIPAIIFIVENYAGFAQATQDTNEEYHEIITRISQEGTGLGIYLVLTSTSPTGVRYSIANNILHAIALHLIEDSEYSTIVGRIEDAVPAAAPGRGLVRNHPIALECQIAIPVDGDIDQRRSNQLSVLSRQMKSAWPGQPARPVLTLPEEITMEHLLGSSPAGDSLQAPLGLRVQDLEIFAPSLNDSTIFLVTGPAKSGKSSLLRNWILGLERLYGRDHVQIYVFDSIAKPLASIQDLESVRGYASFAQQAVSVFETLTQEISARVVAARTDNSAKSGSGRIVIVIDDFSGGEDELGSLPKSLQEQLATIVRRSQLARTTLLVAADTGDIYSAYSDTVRLLKEAQTGFVLSESDDRVFVNMRLPHSERNKALPHGEGYFVRRGQAIRIKFAKPSGEVPNE